MLLKCFFCLFSSSWIVPNKNMFISPFRSFHRYQFLMHHQISIISTKPQISHSSPCTRTILLTCTKPPSFCREKHGFDRAFSRVHVAGENRSIHHQYINWAIHFGKKYIYQLLQSDLLIPQMGVTLPLQRSLMGPNEVTLKPLYIYIYIHIFVNLDYLPQQGNHLNRFPNIQNCHTVSSTWKDSPIFDQRSFGTGDEMSNITKTCNESRESVVVRCPFWKRL